MKRIYMDYAATTPIDPMVEKEMHGASLVAFANPSSLYKEGVMAKMAMDDGRARAARALFAHADELVFTASGTEANNLALTGVVEALLAQGKSYKDIHIVTSVIEHASIIETVTALKQKGVKVDFVPVTPSGIVDLTELKKFIRPHTALVSIMYANNEIGTVQPIREIAKLVRHVRRATTSSQTDVVTYPIFHVDACQAPLWLPLDTRSLGADMITLDGQKMCGPRGIGALWVRRTLFSSEGTSAKNKVAPIILGGGQERGMRSGTENVAEIIGFASALEQAVACQPSISKKVSLLRDRFLKGLAKYIPEAIVNGSTALRERIANNVNISLVERDTEFLLIQLDAAGIACSTKSSCLRDEDESYVIRALGGNPLLATHSLRFTLGPTTSATDIDFTLKTLAHLLKN